jgi:hypothetical protein
MAVALALTALSAGGAHAQGSFSLSTSCPTAFTFPTGTGLNPVSDVSKLTWTFHNPNASSVSFAWQVLEDNAQQGSRTADANSDVSIVTAVGPPKETLVLATVAAGFPPKPCPLGRAVFPAESTPAPTETPSPTATPSATTSTTTAPTGTAQPTATAGAAPAGAASAPPSPPATGLGSRGRGDNSFVLLLLALVLGTAVVGGTTLALSRKRI